MHRFKLATERAIGESVVFGVSVRAWLVILIVGTVCYMSIKALKVEEPLYSLALVASGYYFGRQSGQPKPPLPIQDATPHELTK